MRCEGYLMPVKNITAGKFSILEILPGSIGKQEVDDLRETVESLISTNEKHIVLDFTNASAFNSKILGAIGTLYRKLKERHGSLSVILKDDDMVETFNLSGLNLIVRLLPDQSALGVTEKTGHESTEGLVVSSAEGSFSVLKLVSDMESPAALNELTSSAIRLINGGSIRIAIDLRNITHVSSNMLTCIANCYRSIKERRGILCIITLDDGIRELLAISGLDTLTSVITSEKELNERFPVQERTSPEGAVLIADDSIVMRDLLQKLVREIGFNAITAQNGPEAIEKAVNNRVSLVLMDVTMPGMDGYEACKEIKSRIHDRHIPVIFVTSLSEPLERLNALNAGGDDFINKPVQREDLQFRIRTHLKIKQLMEDMRNMNENLEKMVSEKTNSLMETERQLYQAEKMSTIGTMLSGIAHELKNPIFVISSWAQMLKQRGDLNPEQLKGLDFIQNQAVRSATIVENLLKLVRKKVEEVQFLDLTDIINNVQVNLSYLLTNKAIEVKTELEAKGRIQGNAAEIEQIIINLVSNSVDAIPEKGLITIHTKDDAEWCVIEVEDNGTGMSEEVRKRIFDPFYTTKEAGKGTGLGMSIIYKIVQAHRGRINVASEAGKGTKVTVLFPTLRE
jgi:two-component system NtrC family sensor kinase